MEIILATHSGFCYGVERAVKKAEEALRSEGTVKSLGPIIHNPPTVEMLAERGLGVADSLDEIDSGTVVIRAHGAAPEVYQKAREKGIRVVDTTCPFVTSARHSAEKLVQEGYQLIIVGEKTHPEVIGIYEAVDHQAIVVRDASELSLIDTDAMKRVGIVAQTTQQLDVFKAVIDFFIRTNVTELRIFNTICKDTLDRQEEVEALSRQCDCVLVVGGKNSSNTKKLFRICQMMGVRAFQIETTGEIQGEWFDAVRRVGVVSGASTPKSIIDDVLSVLQEIDLKKRKARV
ncbi:MAG: 4-hydroxy-3-methylbut-2-enyl diphosphate reductase [Candidatus Omnitrophica bacterium]|nr:4-hydroxy-3-methylbut-2-enyl diphosphate reductase [Candidatus Omnitrophota bacterium]